MRPSTPRTGRSCPDPSGSPVIRLIIGLLLLVLGTAGCGQDDSPLPGLAARVPADVTGSGLLLQRGAEGSALLARTLGIDPDDVEATATTAAPAVRILLAPTAGVAQHLREAGFVEGEDVGGGVRVLTRPAGVAGFVGVPAVAVGSGSIVVGGPDQVALVMAGGPPVPVAPGPLTSAVAALVVDGTALASGTATGFAGAVPDARSAVLTVSEDGESGALALLLDRDGSQDDAVAVAVRLRTEGPSGPDGAALLTGGNALTSGTSVVVEVDWAGEAGRALRDGLDGRLLSFLGS